MRMGVVSFGASILALLLVACGGGNEDEAISGVVSPTAIPPSQVIPAPTPEVSGGRFEFPEHGYAAAVPAGWTPSFNFLLQPGVTTDAFFGPQSGDVQPNVSITCVSPPESTTLESYVDQRVNVIRSLSLVEPAVTTVEVAGLEGQRVDYSLSSGGGATIYKSDVFFLTEKCVWTISLVTPESDASLRGSTLDQFLGSFRLLP